MAPRSRLIWPFSITAWKRDTPHLTQAESMGYMNLLMYYWEHGGLPEDDGALRKIAGAEKGVIWREQRRKLKRFFHDGWKHKRMDDDLASAARYSARQRASALRRWNAVDNVDNKNNAAPPRHGKKAKTNQRPVDAVGMPWECSLVKQYKLPSISGSTDAVNKSRQPSKEGASPNQTPSKQHRAAQQAWEEILRRSLSLEDYALAVELLAADPDLVERATKAEMRKPGQGALAAMLGISVREGKP